ncbi:pyocin activator PrtN family protein [Pseudomonas japonica]|uniref:pyocin activator PrtN family protein n=1 Tax=Pseudomonas japonica TaxID=256466 RepID=UPI0015E29DCB|nr:pyocin activator PrtN family protein [Pseudomonas japonica]MBA1289152.1 Pyocin activator protein PrtN [Pseudomonas japonica]
MNTTFLLMAQYGGQVVIPLDHVCRDYFSPLTTETFKRKLASGEIDLPMVQMTRSQKGAKGIALLDLAQYLDRECDRARMESDKLQNRTRKPA